MNEELTVVVFDFDLTLTRWDTADRFFRWLLKRSPWRLFLLLIALPVVGPLYLFDATRKWPIRFAVWVATLGVSQQALARLGEVHVSELCSAGESAFLPEGLAQLQQHLQQGHRVVIATGSLELLAQEFLRRAGYGHVPLIASTLRPFFGGLVRDRHCFGSNKVPMLTERGFSPPWSIAYTDHHCDLPILKLSRERYLISPKPDCVIRIERALAAKLPILDWR